MYHLTSPSPDGMSPLFFFQHFWLAIGNVVIKTVLDFLNLGLSALIRKFVHYDSMRVWLFAVMLLLFLTYFFFYR